MAYKFGNTKRPKEHGLLIAIRKSMNANCQALGIPKEDFAKELGTTHGVLENKLKMSSLTNDVSLSEFIHIMEITGDLSPLEYLCTMFDQVMTSTEPVESPTHESLHAQTDSLQIECSEAFATIKSSLKDDKFTQEEKQLMLRELEDVFKVGVELKDALEKVKCEE